MKKEIRIVVFEDESCEDSLPENPQEFLAWWAEKFSLVPEEYKDTARVNCSAESYRGDSLIEVTISYVRTETDEEEAARLKREDDKRRFIENKELCQLEKLKAKYGV